jgi:protein-tyrosine phosphatase
MGTAGKRRRAMVDFHAHVLPAMDDGSKTAMESQKMLAMLGEQGVGIVVATPHYYSHRESVAEFVERRARSCAMLNAGILNADMLNPRSARTGSSNAEAFGAAAGGANRPRVLLGAEVAFYMGMSQDAELQKLCIEGADKLLLLEMPLGVWGSAALSEVYRLMTVRGITPVLAHIERYAGKKGNGNDDSISGLLLMGALVQSNAEHFVSWRTRRRAFAMLRQGRIHVFGSDCHNLDSRPPNMGKLRRVLRKKLGNAGIAAIDERSKKLLSEPRH